MDAKEKELVQSALGLLNSSADNECYCGEKSCSIDTPRCQAMEVRAAARELTRAIEPEMKSLHPNRLTNPAERIYFDHWRKTNERTPGLNSGFTTLEWILCPSGNTPDVPSQRDAEVATAVIQWLGTNCGRGFVEECERHISKDQAERFAMQKFTVFFGGNGKDRDLFQRLTDKVLRDVLPSEKHSDKLTLSRYSLAHLRSEIRDVFVLLFSLYAAETGTVAMDDCAKSAGMPLNRFKEIVDLAHRSVSDCNRRLVDKKSKKQTA